MSLAVGLLALFVFGSVAAWQWEVEHRDLDAAVEQELKLVGRAMRIAAERVLRTGGPAEVDATLSALREMKLDVQVLLFAPDGSLQAASEGDARHRFAALAPTIDAHTVDRVHVRFDEDALAIVPLITPERALGTLVIVRPLDDVAQDLRREAIGFAGAVLGFAALAALLVYGLGERLVSSPLRRLGTAMERASAGDFDPALQIRRNDEIGRVSADFGRMLEELELARATLEQEQEANRRAQRALQDADRLVTVGQLSAGLAHEIGSPLQVLHGRARRLLRHAEDHEAVRREAGVIADQTERITRIVQQLLDFARRRPQGRRQTPRAALRSVVELLAGEARSRRVEVTLSVSDEVDRGEIDVDPLQQITLNLLRNALQATPSDGRIEIRLVASHLGPPHRRRRSMRLVVTDDGPGIAASLRDQLFEPFFTTRASEGGTGLGLAIVRSIVNELQGTVDVTSEPGRGTEFVVELPLLEVAPSRVGGVT